MEGAVSETHSPSHDRVTQTIAMLLRGAQARGIHDNLLSASSGIPERTIKSYRTDGKDPSLTNALSLLAALGPDAVNAVLATIGYGGARPLGGAPAIDPRQIIADILPHVSTLAQAAADGHFDHAETPACEAAANHIIATVLPISSAGRAS